MSDDEIKLWAHGHEVDICPNWLIIGPDNPDWTICPNNRPMEVVLRERRNAIIKERLQSGESVSYRSSGWSLYPKGSSGDECSYVPVTKSEEVKVHDIVFCQVKPTWRFYAHIVKEKTEKWVNEGDYTQGTVTTFKISNLRGYVNGWCTMESIYGKFVEIRQ